MHGKILFPIGDASEAMDTFYGYYRLPEEGLQVVVAGPERGCTTPSCMRFPPIPTSRGTSPRSGPDTTSKRMLHSAT